MVSAQLLSQLVGGWTWFVLIQRPMLSIFDEVYIFCRENWYRRHIQIPISAGVKTELQVLLGMLPFLEVSLSLPWHTRVYEVDAGPQKTAVISTESDKRTLRLLAAFAERGGWLLRDEETSLGGASDTVEERLASSAGGCSAQFLRNLLPRSAEKPQEVDSSWFSPSRWTVLFSVPLSRKEHNTISEVRACAQAVRHHGSSGRNWHSRLAILSDAGAAIGCLSKGRSSSLLANSLCRQTAAMICVANFRVYYRWVASAHNCADGPSRGSRFPGVDPETSAKARAAGKQVWDAFAAATAASG